ncbi:GSCOCG00011317001-RA-CDS [Cotesia congregata]|uniref:Uncharacterized protein n=1 Tax=Cotesia congregata TaxID=51543 RepID=A0A8J2H973_COTCN|nr:GSCOCG00011317001-RA-CDS [Cotesia congregata]CAG5083450.1 Protein of unknown function [Cotesia congregata]
MKLKIVIVLTFALTIDPSYQLGLNPLESVQQKLDATIDAAKIQLDDNLTAARRKIDQVAAGLKETAESAGQVVYDQIRGFIDKFDDQLKELEKSSGQIDVSDCMALASPKDAIALGAMMNVSTCIIDQLELGDGIPESVFKVTGEVRENLTSVQQESQKCFQDVGFTAVLKATACAAKMTAKATWITANSVPVILTTTVSLTNQMEKLPINVPSCAVNSGIEKLPMKYAELYAQVKQCIDRKTSQA